MTNTDRVSGLAFGWALGFLLAALNSGCAPSPPRTITVSHELPDGIQVAAARARDAWCAAPVGWCPELVEEGGEGAVVVEHFNGERRDRQMQHTDRGGHLVRVRPGIADWSADLLTGAMVHEFGHHGIDGHNESSALMRWRFGAAADIPWTVDSVAAVEWCRQQGC